MIKVMASPPRLQLKQWKRFLWAVTENEAVRSEWKGHKPINVKPFFWKFNVWFEDIFDGKIPDFIYSGLANHNLLTMSQQSMIDCPVYLGRQTLVGLIGLI